MGSAFTQEGGPYEWTKLAFGRFHAGMAAVFYWMTNPLWVGGSLAFVALTRDGNERPPRRTSATAPPPTTRSELAFVWFSIGVAIGLR